MKEILLLMLLSIFFLGCKIKRQTIPTREQVELAMEGYKDWSIGRDKNIKVVDIYYFYPESYVFGIGKVCNMISYCKSNRGDTIAVVDTNSQKQKIQVEDVKMSQHVMNKSDFRLFFNESYTLSYDFINIITAVDSVYLVELD